MFQDIGKNVSPEYVSCTGRGIPQTHDKKISRPTASFMINRTKLKFKNHYFEAPNKYFMSGKVRCVYIHTLTFPVYKMG